jgi:hypothetical protein
VLLDSRNQLRNVATESPRVVDLLDLLAQLVILLSPS